MKKILIAVPTNKYVETDTMKSIYDLIVPEGYTTELQFFYGYQVDQIRNLIADWGKHYDFVFNVDSDIILPSDTLVKMIRADKDVISGLYIQRKPDEHILEVYQDNGRGGVENIPYWAIEGRGVIPIASCGFGCVLIKGEVYRKMEYPHFLYQSAIDHADTVSEDVYFCLKARRTGFSIWTDTSIQCEHVGSTKFRVKSDTKTALKDLSEKELIPQDHQEYLFDMRYRQEVKPDVIYDIGACVGHWTKGAKQVWRDSEIYMVDATTSVEDVLKDIGPYAIEVLTEEDGKELTFYQNSVSPAGNSYYKENTSAYHDGHATKRIGKTLDTLRKERNWPLPQLIKLDVQGAEIDILKGATETLAQVNNVILEAQHIDYNAGAPKVNDVVEFMKSIGFKLVKNFAGGAESGHADGDYHFTRL